MSQPKTQKQNVLNSEEMEDRKRELQKTVDKLQAEIWDIEEVQEVIEEKERKVSDRAENQQRKEAIEKRKKDLIKSIPKCITDNYTYTDYELTSTQHDYVKAMLYTTEIELIKLKLIKLRKKPIDFNLLKIREFSRQREEEVNIYNVLKLEYNKLKLKKAENKKK